MTTVLQILLIAAGAYLSCHVLYSLFLIASNALIKERTLPGRAPATRFAILLPAHNEELLLPRLLESVKAQRYPERLCKPYVIADNCSDKTAGIARSMGAVALERTDLENRGKGQAIKWVLEKIDPESYDAVFIVDADSVLKNDVLEMLDRDLASGSKVIQCYNGIENPDESWFTRLLDVSRAVSNLVYHPAKQKLGFSSTLMGNGMCFSSGMLKKYGWDAFTVGEDWEYYAKLMHRGERVSYNVNARVFHRESANLQQATTQRMRWASGRFSVIWNHAIGLFFKGLAKGDLMMIDASLPLILPNPSLGVNLSIAFLGASLLTMGLFGRSFAYWAAALILLQCGVFMTGILYTENRFKNLLSVFIAPVFLAWKWA